MRAFKSADIPDILEIMRSTNMFRQEDIWSVETLLNKYNPANRDKLPYCIVEEKKAFAYWQKCPLTIKSWWIKWIATHRDYQREGLGTKLLKHIEANVNGQLFIRTSNVPSYEPTRNFYLKNGYKQVGLLPDFYADADDMIIYYKRI